MLMTRRAGDGVGVKRRLGHINDSSAFPGVVERVRRKCIMPIGMPVANGLGPGSLAVPHSPRNETCQSVVAEERAASAAKENQAMGHALDFDLDGRGSALTRADT